MECARLVRLLACIAKNKRRVKPLRINYDRVMTRTLNTSTTAAELVLMIASVSIVAAEFKDRGNCALVVYCLLQVLCLVQIVCRY
jgi:hypothetical protein